MRGRASCGVRPLQRDEGADFRGSVRGLVSESRGRERGGNTRPLAVVDTSSRTEVTGASEESGEGDKFGF